MSEMREATFLILTALAAGPPDGRLMLGFGCAFAVLAFVFACSPTRARARSRVPVAVARTRS